MSRRPTIADLAAFRETSAPVLLPDDSAVIAVRTRVDESGRTVSELVRYDLDGAGWRATDLTSGARDSGPAITPDGTAVLFVRAGDGGSDLSRMPAGGGEPERLTEGLQVTGEIAVSPDGGRAAFTVLVDDGLGDDGVKAPVVVSGLPQHVVDGLGFVGEARHQVFVLDLTDAGATPRRLSVPGDHCGSATWSPDGQTLAFVRTSFADEEAQLRKRVVLAEGFDEAEEPTLRLPFTAQSVSGPLTFEADGARVLAIGSEELVVAPDRLLALDLGTEASEDLNPGLDRGVMGGKPGYPGGAPAYAADGRLYFCIRDEGRTTLRSRGPEGDLREHDLGEGGVVSGLSVGRERAVAVVATPSAPAEVVALDLTSGEVTPVSRDLADALPDVQFLATQPRWFTIGDGTRVHGWLLRDPSTSGPAPTLIDIHGGPHNAWTGVADTAHLYHQELAAAGWNVLTLNPRASDGYGAEFFRATHGAWGEADQQDFVEALQSLVEEGIADADRLVAMGYSYGGFMAGWLSAHTDLFAAVICGGMVSDNRGMTASSDLGGYLRALELGDSPGAEDRLAPITYVDQVRTPTLILHGQQDMRCPVAQAELWYSRLRGNGVPTEMIVYPGGSHVFFLSGPLSHRVDFNRRIVDWAVEHTA